MRTYTTPDFVVEESEEVETVIGPGNCGDQENIVDSPARAFVDYQGFVHLFYDHTKGYQLKGDNLKDLSPVCTPSYQRGFSWLAAPYTEDGKKFTL